MIILNKVADMKKIVFIANFKISRIFIVQIG